MNNIYGITNIRIAAIEALHDHLSEVNEFLKAHDGNIIDIRTGDMLYGMTKYIFIYKETTE